MGSGKSVAVQETISDEEFLKYTPIEVRLHVLKSTAIGRWAASLIETIKVVEKLNC